jgi:hypothetical protein
MKHVEKPYIGSRLIVRIIKLLYVNNTERNNSSQIKLTLKLAKAYIEILTEKLANFNKSIELEDSTITHKTIFKILFGSIIINNEIFDVI